MKPQILMEKIIHERKNAMYHVYEIETQNEGFDWHMYAKSYDDAHKMVISFNAFITQDCRDFANAIHYPSIAPALKAGIENISEKEEIEKFFERFSSPFLKKKGKQGGYALDYRQCSFRKKTNMPYCMMLSYLDTVLDHDFFELYEVNPVFAEGSRIVLPGHRVHGEVSFGMDKRYEYGNEALLAVAEMRMGFPIEFKGESACGKKDIFTLAFSHAVQLCQFLNYLPFVNIYSVLYKQEYEV